MALVNPNLNRLSTSPNADPDEYGFLPTDDQHLVDHWQSMSNAWDMNGDGVITAEEFNKTDPSTPSLAGGPGKFGVGVSPAADPAPKRIEDVNGDGKVTINEIIAYEKQLITGHAVNPESIHTTATLKNGSEIYTGPEAAPPAQASNGQTGGANVPRYSMYDSNNDGKVTWWERFTYRRPVSEAKPAGGPQYGPANDSYYSNREGGIFY